MNSKWPHLSYEEAKDTYQTLHLMTQIAGKIRMSRLPWINHSWHVALFTSSTGLTTLSLPDKDKFFQLDFDFVEHKLKISASSGEKAEAPLKGLSVAQFYHETISALDKMGIEVKINKIPNELIDVVPFDEDNKHAAYEPEHAYNLHLAMLSAKEALAIFRSKFRGKCSPVHFFWGSFDIAVTRFSGRPAPEHPGGIPHLPDRVVREAYSHEVSSAGFWPGNETLPYAAFYSYAYPEPEGFKNYKILPEDAFYDKSLMEFILPYEAVRRSEDPHKKLMNFFETTYEAAAENAKWDRNILEFH